MSHRKAEPLKPTEEVKLSEEEQWRLINESGVLERLSRTGHDDSKFTEVETRSPLPDEIFNATLLIIPFSFLLLMFEMCVISRSLEHRRADMTYDPPRLIHHQYAKQPSLRDLIDRMAPGVPSEYVVVASHRTCSQICAKFCRSSYSTVRMLYSP